MPAAAAAERRQAQAQEKQQQRGNRHSSSVCTRQQWLCCSRATCWQPALLASRSDTPPAPCLLPPPSPSSPAPASLHACSVETYGLFSKKVEWVGEDYSRLEDGGQTIITRQLCHMYSDGSTCSQYLVGRKLGPSPPRRASLMGGHH